MNFAGADIPVQLLAEAALRYQEGAWEAGRALADEALAHAKALGDEGVLCEAYLSAGCGRVQGPAALVAEGVALLSEAIRCGEGSGHTAAVREGYRLLATAHMSLGELASARACLLHHRELAQEEGLTEAVLVATADIADLALAMGAFEEALGEIEAVEPALLDADRRELWAQAIAIRAVALLYLGYVHDPLRLLDQAQRTAGTLKSEGLELRIYEQLVPALMFLGRFTRAGEICERGLQLASALGEREAGLAMMVWAGELARRVGDLERAHQWVADAYAAAREWWTPSVLTGASLALARLDLAEGRLEDAITRAAEGLALAEPAGDMVHQAELQTVIGEAALRLGAFEQATEAFDEALAAADGMNSPHHRAIALFGLGRSTDDIQQLNLLHAQAVDNLNVYLEQLSVMARRDFLRFEERLMVVEGPLPGSAPALNQTTPKGDSASFQGFLRMSNQPGADSLQQAFMLLDDVFSLVTSRLPLDELLQRINDTFLSVSHSSRSLIYISQENGELRLRDRQSSPDSLTMFGPDEACAQALTHVCQTGQTLWLMDTLSDPAYAELPEVEHHGVRGILCIPLKVNDGQSERVIGCLYGDRQAPWVGIAEREVTLLELMAKHISVTLEMRILQDESTRKAQHLEIINSLSRALAGTLDLEHLLSLALGHILKVTHGEQGYIFFGAGQDMTCRASMDRQGRPIEEVQVSRSVIARVVGERQPLAILDIGQDEELQSKASLVVRNVRSVMCVPLVREEQLIGLVYISSSTTNKTFTRNDLDLMAAIASQVALALLNARAYETIKDLNAGLEEKVRERTAELELAYRELTETQDQLVQTEKLATIGTLAGGVAHEINNPLGAILTNAQLLRLDIEDPEHQDSLAMIEEGARRCKDIVEALLKYSRLAKNNQEPVNLRALAEEVLATFERQLQQAEVRVIADFESVPTILGDSKELKQVVSNLVLNAMDALHEKHGLTGGRLAVRIVRALTGLRLIVEDDGVGIDPEVQKRIFDPFYTTKTIGAGTGLGLSVCQRIVERHGGQITVQSTPGDGSTFTVELPVP